MSWSRTIFSGSALPWVLVTSFDEDASHDWSSSGGNSVECVYGLSLTDASDCLCELFKVADEKYGFSDVEDFGVCPAVGDEERLEWLKLTESGSILSVSLANSSGV